MASTAIAVLIGSAIEDPKLAMEFLPVLFVPQILFAGFFVNPNFIPAWYVFRLCRLVVSAPCRAHHGDFFVHPPGFDGHNGCVHSSMV